MRILQLIDSLEAGGAEKMAVSYANALARNHFSGLIATRKEGILRTQIQSTVDYAFLQRKYRIDLRAIRRLLQYCRIHNVEIIHAHSSSFFIAILAKVIRPDLKVVWHDHDGMSEFVEKRNVFVYRVLSIFLTGIIAVNLKLKGWAEKELYCSNVIFIPNFVQGDSSGSPKLFLKGINNKRILCLANLREQKDHHFLLEIAHALVKMQPDWSFHLVGKIFKDNYSALIQQRIISENLDEKVFLYGSQDNIDHIMSQCQIGILTSKSEGLPIALLEYAKNRLAVVVTKVGEIPSIVDGLNGKLVSNGNIDQFRDALETYILNPELRRSEALKLNQFVSENYSEESVIRKYESWIKKIKDAK